MFPSIRCSQNGHYKMEYKSSVDLITHAANFDNNIYKFFVFCMFLVIFLTDENDYKQYILDAYI